MIRTSKKGQDNGKCTFKETRSTSGWYERLQSLNYTKQQAKEKIAAVLLEEICDVLKSNEHYNEERYTERLESID